MTAPRFIVFTLPRSRSAWLSAFLSHGNRACGHDIAIDCASVADFTARLETLTGTVETGSARAWRLIREAYPKIKIVVVNRPIGEVRQSLRRVGIKPERADLETRQAQMAALSTVPGVLTVAYKDLESERCCAAIFEHCLGIPFDADWWDALDAENIQIDIPEVSARLYRKYASIEALKREVADRDAALLRRARVTYQLESWAAFETDAAVAMARDHFNEVEKQPDPRRPFRLDSSLAAQIDRTGVLKIVTARLLGELIGYCFWTVTPDVECRGLLIAQQGPWYVKPSAGKSLVGPHLFTHSIRILKTLGVHCAFPHHRTHGRGAKLGKFYSALGAVKIQDTYQLWIGDA